MNIEPITFHIERDDSLHADIITAERWPERTVVGIHLLRYGTGHPAKLAIEDGLILIRLTHETGVYRLSSDQSQAHNDAIVIDKVEVRPA